MCRTGRIKTRLKDLRHERFHTRFRLGGIRDNKEENWQVGAGLITGSDDPTSGNDIWNEVRLFETGDTRLDYAYVKHRWDDVSMTLGQHKNSYKTSWVLWSGDVRLACLTLAYSRKESFIFRAPKGPSLPIIEK